MKHTTLPTLRFAFVPLASALVALLPLAGCTSDYRATRNEADLIAQRTIEIAKANDAFAADVSDMVDQVARSYEDYEAGRRSTPPEVNILAISGGGDYGAFGAGFLVGWGKAESAAARRPQFDAVTGVSTGGLIAPFAYACTDECCEKVEAFYREPRSDWVQSRGLFFFLPHFASFMTIPGLERDIKGVMDDKMVAALAEQRRKGRLLVISATNLDLTTQHAWEVGGEAIKAQESGDSSRISKIMLASAAIPTAFPPVEIDGFLYADGSVTANIFLRLDPTNPRSFLQVWRKKFPNRPFPRFNYWILVNNWLQAPPKTVEPRWPSVISPSLTTSVRSATLAEIRWLSAEARFVNAVYKTDIQVRMVAIPNDWRPPVEGDFKKETMASLADIGRKMGADPASWKLLASPELSKAVNPEPLRNDDAP